MNTKYLIKSRQKNKVKGFQLFFLGTYNIYDLGFYESKTKMQESLQCHMNMAIYFENQKKLTMEKVQ